MTTSEKYSRIIIDLIIEQFALNERRRKRYGFR
nr:MAG TPA: hypothetical protein [Caudoviricetes sp.]DAS90075.1 MAG TPA: hypothetical protein [Caudoviricetes sp.]